MEPKGPGDKKGFEKEPEVITVDQHEVMKVIETGDIGGTTDLGNCFGVIIYNPED